jgi:hypothetical protein
LYDEDSDWGPFAYKGDTKQSPEAAELLALKVRIFGISENIGDVNYLTFH